MVTSGLNGRYLGLLSVLGFFIVSIGTALLLLRLQDWFGKGDIEAFLIWSVPLAIALYHAPALLDRRIALLPVWSRYLLTSALGPFLALLWTLVIMIIMGGWFYAFSFNVFFCWVTGSLFALLFNMAAKHLRSWPIALCLFVVVSLSIGAGLMLIQSRPYPPDMVIEFKPGTTTDEAIEFGFKVVGSPDIVSAAGNRGADRFQLSFRWGVTKAEREELRQRLLKSPLVLDIHDRPSEPRSDEKYQ